MQISNVSEFTGSVSLDSSEDDLQVVLLGIFLLNRLCNSCILNG